MTNRNQTSEEHYLAAARVSGRLTRRPRGAVELVLQVLEKLQTGFGYFRKELLPLGEKVS